MAGWCAAVVGARQCRVVQSQSNRSSGHPTHLYCGRLWISLLMLRSSSSLTPRPPCSTQRAQHSAAR